MRGDVHAERRPEVAHRLTLSGGPALLALVPKIRQVPRPVQVLASHARAEDRRGGGGRPVARTVRAPRRASRDVGVARTVVGGRRRGGRGDREPTPGGPGRDATERRAQATERGPAHRRAPRDDTIRREHPPGPVCAPEARDASPGVRRRRSETARRGVSNKVILPHVLKYDTERPWLTSRPSPFGGNDPRRRKEAFQTRFSHGVEI